VAVSIPDLCVDLVAETVVLTECLAAGARRLGNTSGDTVTPAVGWNVRDQMTHLLYFDQAVTTAVVDPAGFETERADLMGRAEGAAEAVAAASRDMSMNDVATKFAEARAAMINAFSAADPATRVPWFGPTMSLGAALTARIMETWAHGQDVFDAFGLVHPVTRALRQVAHIGVRALPNSYRTRGLDVPDEPVRVELTTPNGETWTWGEPDAADRVSGPAVDFCLVVTQRRHIDDTSLVCNGPVATEWMTIAQAFAGGVGTGRRPGQFPTR
jgi:uncharacterized protein (TIGR03084 family)